MGPAPSGKPVTLNSKAVPVGMAPTRTGADLCGFLCPGCKPSTSTLQGVSRYHAPFTGEEAEAQRDRGAQPPHPCPTEQSSPTSWETASLSPGRGSRGGEL